MEQMITTKIEAEELLGKISRHKAAIKKAEDERDAFIAHFESKIQRAHEIFNQSTENARNEIAFAEELLRRFAAANLPEGKKSIDLPSGKLSFRKQAPQFFFDDLKEVNAYDPRLIDFCKSNAPEFVKRKVTETADWSEMKKRLSFDGGKVFFSDSGELIEGLTAQEFPDKFTVTVF